MTATALIVRIGNAAKLVGNLKFESTNGRQHSVFSYADSWINDPEGFPIAPSLPFAQKSFFSSKSGNHHGYAFPAPINDTCPDAWGQAIIKRDHRANSNPLTDLDYLTGVDDIARLGALRFQTTDGTFVRPTHIVPPLLDLKDLLRAADAVEARTETKRDIARLIGIGSAMGGARPKCCVADDDGTLMIAKFQSANDSLPVERAEVATLKLARIVGIKAPNARILTVAGRPVALIDRFDRSPNGRIQFISAQTMLERNEAVGASYEEIATSIRANANAPQPDLTELFSRVAFSILVSNVDDHLRNHGFIYVGHQEWTLSPVFDVNPSPDREKRLKTRISEESDDEANIETLIASSLKFGIKANDANKIVSEMATLIGKNWKSEMKSAGMKESEIAAYADAFEHSESRRAKFKGPSRPATNRPTTN